MKPVFSRSRQAAGFTLIEILVSLGVLGLMMIGVAQILSGTLSTTLGAYKHMDADTQARTVLDRIANDFAHIVKRPDVDYYFQKNTVGGAMHGNDQMAFYSESSGYYPSGVTSTSGGGDVSLVGYMIAPMQNGVYNAAGTPQLVRLSKGLAMNGYSSTMPAMIFNPLANAAGSSLTSNTLTANWTGIANGTDSNYQVIGDQVFRMEYTFLVNTSPSGVMSNGSGTPKTCTSRGFYDYPWSPTDSTSSTGSANSMNDVTAIVISIAVLDTKSRAMLGGNTASYLNTASSDLPKDTCTTSALTNYNTSGATTTGYLPLALWKTQLTAAAHLGLPKSVYGQVRFYQRFCYLNHVQ